MLTRSSGPTRLQGIVKMSDSAAIGRSQKPNGGSSHASQAIHGVRTGETKRKAWETGISKQGLDNDEWWGNGYRTMRGRRGDA